MRAFCSKAELIRANKKAFQDGMEQGASTVAATIIEETCEILSKEFDMSEDKVNEFIKILEKRLEDTTLVVNEDDDGKEVEE